MKPKYLLILAGITAALVALLILWDRSPATPIGKRMEKAGSYSSPLDKNRGNSPALPKESSQGAHWASTQKWIDGSVNRYQAINNHDEKLAIVSSLASLASRLPNGGDRNYVLERLHEMATANADHAIKAFAVINYSRLGPPSAAYRLLQASLRNHVIDKDTYYSEIARLSLNPETTQAFRSDLLVEFATSESKYASEVLFSIIPTVSLSSLRKQDFDVLIDYADKNRPQFSRDITSIGVSSAMVYTHWLYSTAVLSAGSNDPDRIIEYLLRRFEAGFSDPREAVSIFINNPFDQHSSAQAQEFSRIVKLEVDRYARSYPNNPIIQEITALPQPRR